MSSQIPGSTSSPCSLQLRTSLLEAVQRFHATQRANTADQTATSSGIARIGDKSDNGSSSSSSSRSSSVCGNFNTADTPAGESGSATSSLLKLVVESNPSVTNPTWAMEECGRLCPNLDLWNGSALPREVWAPPGTAECPFGTAPADYRLQR